MQHMLTVGIDDTKVGSGISEITCSEIEFVMHVIQYVCTESCDENLVIESIVYEIQVRYCFVQSCCVVGRIGYVV